MTPVTATVELLTCRAGLHPWPDSAYTRSDGKQHCRDCASGRTRRGRGRHPGPVMSMVSRLPNLPGAACVEYPELPWVPDVGVSRGPIQACRDVCNTCPVLVRCREFALSDLSLHGIWGGLSWNQRRELAGAR